MLNVILTKYVYTKSILYNVFIAYVLTVFLDYPWTSTPPSPLTPDNWEK
jgi:hypothetical protein